MVFTILKKDGKKESYPTMLDVLRHAEEGDTIIKNGDTTATLIMPAEVRIGKEHNGHIGTKKKDGRRR